MGTATLATATQAVYLRRVQTLIWSYVPIFFFIKATFLRTDVHLQKKPLHTIFSFFQTPVVRFLYKMEKAKVRNEICFCHNIPVTKFNSNANLTQNFPYIIIKKHDKTACITMSFCQRRFHKLGEHINDIL